LTGGMTASIAADDDRAANLCEQRVKLLNRQLEIEMKIKAGAENMLNSFSNGPKKDKKLCDEAHAMLKDAKLKIEYIRMQLNRSNHQENYYKDESICIIQARSFQFLCFSNFPFVEKLSKQARSPIAHRNTRRRTQTPFAH
jgi:hypothetical protein